MLAVLISARSACTEQANILTRYCVCHIIIFKMHVYSTIFYRSKNGILSDIKYSSKSEFPTVS
jgi:hypothetical protein